MDADKNQKGDTMSFIRAIKVASDVARKESEKNALAQQIENMQVELNALRQRKDEVFKAGMELSRELGRLERELSDEENAIIEAMFTDRG
jgi:septal ring factor EnvC (AmiA/AmiB activator)